MRLPKEMKMLFNLSIFISLVMVLMFQIAHIDAAAFNNEKLPMIESSSSDENDASLRNKKEVGTISVQHIIPAPHRRHHLKFGVLGKRHAYGYLGKRAETQELYNDFDDWLNDGRERRGNRPQYGLLG
ncbi:unnamed protein product [Adineta steineri]|uniref:Uncharacterized protein n=3 Tax=Adineta steineri TaxID=433720 RepID=A0A813XIX5_9BILA|nr:unnamed protein product [Adineta steineri]CAF0931644.1 unnamed protein product [Adineta steineri]